EITNSATKTQNKSCAMPMKAVAIPPNPKTAATTAAMKKPMAQPSMTNSSNARAITEPRADAGETHFMVSGFRSDFASDRHAQNFLIGLDHLVADGDHGFHLRFRRRNSGDDIDDVALAASNLHRAAFGCRRRLSRFAHGLLHKVAEIDVFAGLGGGIL